MKKWSVIWIEILNIEKKWHTHADTLFFSLVLLLPRPASHSFVPRIEVLIQMMQFKARSTFHFGSFCVCASARVSILDKAQMCWLSIAMGRRQHMCAPVPVHWTLMYFFFLLFSVLFPFSSSFSQFHGRHQLMQRQQQSRKIYLEHVNSCTHFAPCVSPDPTRIIIIFYKFKCDNCVYFHIFGSKGWLRAACVLWYWLPVGWLLSPLPSRRHSRVFLFFRIFAIAGVAADLVMWHFVFVKTEFFPFFSLLLFVARSCSVPDRETAHFVTSVTVCCQIKCRSKRLEKQIVPRCPSLNWMESLSLDFSFFH